MEGKTVLRRYHRKRETVLVVMVSCSFELRTYAFEGRTSCAVPYFERLDRNKSFFFVDCGWDNITTDGGKAGDTNDGLVHCLLVHEGRSVSTRF